MTNVVRLIPNNPNPPVPRHCGNCKWRSGVGTFAKCGAANSYADFAWRGECQRGRFWEPKPEPKISSSAWLLVTIVISASIMIGLILTFLPHQ